MYLLKDISEYKNKNIIASICKYNDLENQEMIKCTHVAITYLLFTCQI